MGRLSCYCLCLSSDFHHCKCICLKLQNIFVSNCKMYVFQIVKCICLNLQNVFVSNCKMYFSQIVWSASLSNVLGNSLEAQTGWRQQDYPIDNSLMYLSQIAKCICLKLQNVFVSNFKMYSSQIAKCIFLELSEVQVWQAAQAKQCIGQ